MFASGRTSHQLRQMAPRGNVPESQSFRRVSIGEAKPTFVVQIQITQTDRAQRLILETPPFRLEFFQSAGISGRSVPVADEERSLLRMDQKPLSLLSFRIQQQIDLLSD